MPTSRPLKTHCLLGHAFTPENTRLHGKARHCRACARLRRLRYAQAAHAAALTSSPALGEHPVASRFLRLVNRAPGLGPAGNCWELRPNRAGQTSGAAATPAAADDARRLAYELAHGPLAAGQVLRPGCGNWRCVSPLHAAIAGTVAPAKGLG